MAIDEGIKYSHYNQRAKFVSLQAYYTIAGRDLERELGPLLLDQKTGLIGMESVSRWFS